MPDMSVIKNMSLDDDTTEMDALDNVPDEEYYKALDYMERMTECEPEGVDGHINDFITLKSNTKIDWKLKFSSRKFWALIVGFITPLLITFGVTDNIVSQVAAIITAGGAVIAYIFAESNVDKNRINENAEYTEDE